MLSSLGGALRSFAKSIDKVGAKLQEQVVIPKRKFAEFPKIFCFQF